MSRANAEVRNAAVRRFIWAFDRDTDAFRESLHPDIEWCPIEENRVPLHGVEAAMRNRNEWLETWDEHGLVVEEVVEDGDSVVALLHITARGSGSGAGVDVRFYAQFRVSDGRVAYIYDHEDRNSALEAADLS